MKNGKTTERRNTHARQIKHMLEERDQLLELLLHVSNLKPGRQEQQDLELLDEFCQVLVDYVAAGHFGLYQRIEEGTERRKDLALTAKTLYPLIMKTTQQALEFSERYSADNGDRNLANLARDLSGLSVALTYRIELEDQLISKLQSVKMNEMGSNNY